MKANKAPGRNSIAMVVLLASSFVPIFSSQLHAVEIQAAQAEHSEFLNEEEFLKILRSENIDKILRATNTIKRMHYQGDMLAVVLGLWSEDKNKYPDLPWPVVSSDIVRLEFANILAQAESNGFIDLDVDPLHQYVRELLNTKDKYVLDHALQTVYIFNSKVDVQPLYDIAKNSKGSIFRSAIISLSLMCNLNAVSALDQLTSRETDSSKRQFIEETRAVFDACPSPS